MNRSRHGGQIPTQERETYQKQRARMNCALADYWSDQVLPISQRQSLHDLAKKYAVRRSTLSKYVADGLEEVPEAKPGRTLALSHFHECLLALWALVQQAIGCSIEPIHIRHKQQSWNVCRIRKWCPRICRPWVITGTKDLRNDFPFFLFARRHL